MKSAIRLIPLLVLCAGLSFTFVPKATADMTCTEGHVFWWNGQEYCNPGSGPEGCLNCSETIVVGGGCTDPDGCVQNPTP